MKKYLKFGIIVFIVAAITVFALFFPVTKTVETESESLASKFCLENNGLPLVQNFILINGTEITQGICKFPNGSQCEEWEYFSGECKPSP